MPDVTIRLLGGFAAAVDGEPVPDSAWRLRKARELVKLLALAPGHRLHREQAMDVLWRDRDPAAAVNNLHQAVHVARRALGAEAIASRDELLLLDAEVDVDDFEQAAAAARRAGTAAAYRAAQERYAGELLPENRYDEWAEPRREELAELQGTLERERAALDSPDGLGALPADASSFVGRGYELAELRALLARTRLLTLSGPGGVGKTRLGLRLARETAGDFPDGVAAVELAATSDPRLVPGAVAAALDVRALPGSPLEDAVADFLAPRAVLLVLDNCEHLLGAAAGLADRLLRAAPRLTLVATSREPLRVPGEAVFRVPSLAIPDPELRCGPEELLRFEAVRLLVERAGAAAPEFALDPDNAGDVARICFRLDGLPLALELAAARVAALGPAAVAERLDDRFRLLRAGSRTAPTRQQTLAATLQWSHDLLDDDERTLFRRLAAFAGGFDLAAAEAVCPGDGLAAEDVPDLLARLVEKSLVVADGGGRERRFRLLETVHLYARERLAEAGEAAGVAARHAVWALELAEREGDGPRLDQEAANLRVALDTLLGRRPEDALRLCVALWEFWLRRIDLMEGERRFTEALAAAPARTPLRAAALLGAGALDLRAGVLAAVVARGRESFEIAAELGDDRAEWEALHFLAGASFGRDDAEDALAWSERAAALARREGHAAQEAISVYSTGVAHWLLGDLAGAEARIVASLEAFRAIAGSPERVPSPVNIAEMRTGGSRRAPGLRIVFEETLQPFVRLTCDAAIVYVLANLAALARVNADLGRARALLDEASERLAGAGDDRDRAALHARRAYLELDAGDPQAAQAELERALALRRRENDRRGVGLVLAGLGHLETVEGDHAAAAGHLDEALGLFRRAGDRWGLASTLWRRAELAFAQGRAGEAEAALQEALGVLRETQRLRWIANTLSGLADAALLQGDPDRARRLLEEARDRYAANHDAVGVDAVEARLSDLAKPAQSARERPPSRTPPTPTMGRNP